jgi:Bestrophin, RFP-TM, chloride channel
MDHRRKSRHYRDESDPLLGAYSETIAATSSVRRHQPLFQSLSSSLSLTRSSPNKLDSQSSINNNGGSSHDDSGILDEAAAFHQQIGMKSSAAVERTTKMGYYQTLSDHNTTVNNNIGSRRRNKNNNNSNTTNKTSKKKKKKTNDVTSSSLSSSSLSTSMPLAPHLSRSKTNSSSNNKNNNKDNDKSKSKFKKSKSDGYRIHRVSYSASSHVEVLFRLYGSAFPHVFPFVVVNTSWTLLVYWLKQHTTIDLTFHSSIGHSFMGLLVSFLIVSRSQISYHRFMEYRKLLAKCYRISREICHLTTVYTMFTITPLAMEWRQQVCYETILLLRITMDALLWSSSEKPAWIEEYYQDDDDDDEEDGEDGDRVINNNRSLETSSTTEEEDDEDDDDDDDMNGDSREEDIERQQQQQQINGDATNDCADVTMSSSDHFQRFRYLTHGRRSQIDEHFRAPITRMHILKTTIMAHPLYLGYKLPVNEYRDLVLLVSEFDDTFHGFRVLVFTPYPFPVSTI